MAHTGKKTKNLHIVCWYKAESDKAIFVLFRDGERDIIGDKWLPKSRVSLVQNGEEGFTSDGLERGEKIVVAIPEWLAEKPDIAELIREQVMADEGEDDDVPF